MKQLLIILFIGYALAQDLSANKTFDVAGTYQLTPNDYGNVRMIKVEMHGSSAGSNACSLNKPGCIPGGTGGSGAYMSALISTDNGKSTFYITVGQKGYGSKGSFCDLNSEIETVVYATDGTDTIIIDDIDAVILVAGGGYAPVDYPSAGQGGQVKSIKGAEILSQQDGNAGFMATCNKPSCCCQSNCTIGLDGNDGFITVFFLPDGQTDISRSNCSTSNSLPKLFPLYIVAAFVAGVMGMLILVLIYYCCRVKNICLKCMGRA